jgi:hypothetical protein
VTAPVVWLPVVWHARQSAPVGVGFEMAGCAGGKVLVEWQSTQSRGPAFQATALGVPPMGLWQATVQVVTTGAIPRARVPPAVVVPSG